MIALVPGSYDPITKGHLNIIERASAIADQVYVAVMNNDSSKHDKTLKSKTYMLTPEQRLNTVKLATKHLNNVESLLYPGMLIDLFDELKIDTVFRGIRNSEDLEYEIKHAKWNREHNPKYEVVFLLTREEYANISSSHVKEAIANNNNDYLSQVLPKPVADYIINLGVMYKKN